MSIPGYRPDPLNSTSRHNPTAARVRRARSASVSQSNKSCQAFIPFVPRLYVCYCGTAKCQCCHELQIWMNIESAWLTIWLLKQVKKPYMVLYVSNHGTISTHVHFKPDDQYPQRSCYADQHVLILVLKYMYMLWPLDSWANDGVRA